MYRLKGSAAWAASLACTVVLVLAFILPVGVLVKYAIVYADEAWNGAFFNYAWQSFKVAVVVSIATILLSLLVLFYQRIAKQAYPLIPGRLASTGYAIEINPPQMVEPAGISGFELQSVTVTVTRYGMTKLSFTLYRVGLAL